MTFPVEKMVLGRYCGPSIDVGPALTAKILIKNGKIFHMSTYMALTPYEFLNPYKIKSCDEFDMELEEKLFPAASAKYLESDPQIVTPTLDKYEDEEEHQNHMPEVDEITPESMNNYIGAEIMIYHGYTVDKVSGRRRKHDV